MTDRSDFRRDSRKDHKKDDTEDRLVIVNRITKVVEGGRRTRFAIVVIVGDRKGHVGFGAGKAQEVPRAIRKAVEADKKRMTKVPTVGTTISYEVVGHYGSGNIMLKSAEAGSGVTAGGAVRIIIDLIGTSDATSRSLGSNTPINVIRATTDGLNKLKTHEDVLRLRESVKSLED